MRIMIYLFILFVFTIWYGSHYGVKAGNIKHNEDFTQFLFDGVVEQGNSREILHAYDDTILYMQSPGGDAWESLQMGYIIKAKRLHVSTYKNAACDSACAFAAIMGESITGRFGFHAPYPKGHTPTASEKEYVSSIFINYMRSSGRLTEEQIVKIMRTPPELLYYIEWK